MLLRSNPQGSQKTLALALALGIGILAAVLVVAGNPGNMGLCGACFLRDISGSLSLFSGPGPKVFRPEILGIMLGAMAFAVLRGPYAARSGSHASTRLFFGFWMGVGSLVFLGCPFRMLQRIGGGDVNAMIGAVGLIAGVGTGVFFERRGYRVGSTSVVHPGVGVLGPLAFLGILGLFLARQLTGPGPGDVGAPAHAFWLTSLGVATVAGVLLSWTGFCAVSATRQIFSGPRLMLIAAILLILGYMVVLVLLAEFKGGVDGQPAAHGDHLWSILALYLVGLTGCLAGGCPVRQVVMAGEGNGDAFCSVVGIMLGGALAHNLGWAASGKGTTDASHYVVVIGIVVSVAYAVLATRRSD